MAIKTAYLVDGCELKGEPNFIDFRLTEDELEAMRKRAAKLEREGDCMTTSWMGKVPGNCGMSTMS
jgi:hypothetical protein